MEMTPEQRAFVQHATNRWAEGWTQQAIADELGMALGTLRNRLKYYGYEFGRAGKMLAMAAEELEPVTIIADEG